MALSSGDKLGPYEILAKLGEGGMGEVWKARDTRLNRPVAVKRLKGQHNARFEQEARAIAALNHPHICQIFDIGPDYLVLEYIDGHPLTGGIDAAHAVRLAMQIAEALDAAHRKGVVHRDLKPANIMVTAEGSIKLLDFGLAKQTASTDDNSTIEGTQIGTVMGTAAYMAPEQTEGKPLDARSDIFSFGSVLYELLSGRRAFHGETAIATMAAILRDEPAPLEAPAALQAIVKRCLAKRPGQRYQTMAELRDDLGQAMDTRTLPRTNTPTHSSPSIAVLPFANMGADPDHEYFSDGLAEEIINVLAQIPGLKVTARTSAFAFKGKTEDIRTIAGTLGVATILEGSVRRSGSRLRVNAQLINASDGYHLWSQRYDREMADLFDVQDEIAQAIASALQVTLSRTLAPFMQYKPGLPAYEALLKARHYRGLLRPELFPRARECFEQAIALDPKFVQAHCEYGIYFMMMVVLGLVSPNEGWSMVRVQAQKALDLDPSLAEGHAMLGTVAGSLEYGWTEAARHFRLAMAHDPVPVNVRLYYSLHLMKVGRPAEAVQQADLGLREDPLNILLHINRASYLAAAGRDEDAAEGYRATLELNPSMVLAKFNLGGWHATLGEWDRALRYCEEAYAVAPLPRVVGLLAGLLRITGDLPRADDMLRRLQPTDAPGVPLGLAIYHWVLQEFDAQADWFEKAIDQRDPISSMLVRSWYGANLRATPRWGPLMRKLNLPES